MNRVQVPLPLGEGGGLRVALEREPDRAKPQDAKREPDRAKPQEKSNQILRPSPYPLPEGEGEFSVFQFIHSF